MTIDQDRRMIRRLTDAALGAGFAAEAQMVEGTFDVGLKVRQPRPDDVTTYLLGMTRDEVVMVCKTLEAVARKDEIRLTRPDRRHSA